MSKNFWADSDNFNDSPDDNTEPQDGPADPPGYRAQRQPVPQQQVVVYEEEAPEPLSEEDEEALDVSVLTDARLRLEQGKLYELIMNNSLFDEGDADPRAVKNVQREIKRFARERMEIMLGMRQEPTKQAQAIVSSPFNDMEVMVLKQLASAATKGASASEEANQGALPVARKPTINSISTKKAAAPAPKPLAQKPAPAPAKKLAAGPQPIARKVKIDNEVIEIPVEHEAPLDKPIHEMTEAEKIARNQRIAERQAQKKAAIPTNILPQPTFEQQRMMYATRAMDPPPGLANVLGVINQGGRK